MLFRHKTKFNISIRHNEVIELKIPGPTPTATPTGASAAMSSGCTTSWTRPCPRSAACPRSATAGTTCPASSPLAAAWVPPMRSTCTCVGRTSSAAVWRSAASIPPTMASATTWTSWCTRTLPWTICGTSPPTTPIWSCTGTRRRSSAAARAPGSSRTPPGTSSASSRPRASPCGWTCGATTSSTTGTGGINRSCITCRISWDSSKAKWDEPSQALRTSSPERGSFLQYLPVKRQKLALRESWQRRRR